MQSKTAFEILVKKTKQTKNQKEVSSQAGVVKLHQRL